VKTPKGELTGAELRKLIRAHNILVSIKIPAGTDREGLIKLIEGKGYKVDHKKKAIIDSKKDRPRRPKVTLDKAKELTKPKPKTALQQQKAVEAKAEKAEKKKKQERVIRKKAVEEEKKRAKPKPKPKSVSIGVGTEDKPKKKEEPKKKTDTKLEINFRSKKQKEIIKNPTNQMVREAIRKQYPDYSGYDRINLINLVLEGMEKGKVGRVEVLEKKNAGKDLQIQQNLIGTSEYGKRIILKKKEEPKKEELKPPEKRKTQAELDKFWDEAEKIPIEDYINKEIRPYKELYRDIGMINNNLLIAISGGDLLGSKSRSFSSAQKALNKELDKEGFEFLFELYPTKMGGKLGNRRGDIALKLFNEYRDKNKLTTSKAWNKLVKLAEKANKDK